MAPTCQRRAVFISSSESVAELLHIRVKVVARATDSNDVTRCIFYLQMLLLILFLCLCCPGAALAFNHISYLFKTILRYFFFLLFLERSVNGTLSFLSSKSVKFDQNLFIFQNKLQFKFSHKYCASYSYTLI